MVSYSAVMIWLPGESAEVGQAACTTSALSPGSHIITAEYDTISPNFTGSRGALPGGQIVGGVFDFSQPLYTAAERGGSVTINVTRTGSTTQATTVDYATEDGSNPAVFVPCSSVTSLASERCDYTRAAGTLSFGPNETQESFVVLVGDDSYVEGAETLTLRLTHPGGTGALGAQSVSTLQITDDATESTGNPIADAAGLAFWVNEIESCGPNAECREVKRVNVSAAFFLSIEFQQTGFLVERV